MSLDTVKQAIVALSEPSQTIQANEWLVNFEKSSDAWTIADELLTIPSEAQFNFFGAKFKYSKIQKDFYQLNDSMVNEMLIKIVDHIIRLSNSPQLEISVCRYLCLSLAALAVQINQEGVILQILNWFNAIASTNPGKRIILELLIALPEECFNRQVDVTVETRDRFSQQLSTSVNEVFGFLYSLTETAANDEVLSLMLKCLSKWIDHTTFPAMLLANHPLYHYTLNCLIKESLFEPAADSVISAIQKFRCSDLDLLKVTAPHIISSRSLWRKQLAMLDNNSDSEDTAICRAICRLFTEAGEAYLEAIILEDYSTIGVDLSDIVKELVIFTKFPYDHNVARIPLCYFMESEIPQLAEYMKKSESLYNRFVPVFYELFDTAIQQLILPSKMLCGVSNIDLELVDARLDWKNTITDCCNILGNSTCLQRSCEIMQGELTVAQNSTVQLNWGKLEACLFSIQTIVKYKPNENHPVFHDIMKFISTLSTDSEVLRITVIDLIGSFSVWLSTNGEYLSQSLEYLFVSLRCSVSTTSIAAARGISRIFMSCAGIHELPLSNLMGTIIELRTTNSLALGAELLLLEGCCSVVSKSPLSMCKEYMISLVEPIAHNLLNGLSVSNPAPIAIVASNIDRLTACLGRVVIMEGSIVAEVFLKVQPILQSVLEIYRTSEYVCEKVCRCYKHSIRSSRRGFTSLLPAMTIHLADNFQKNSIAAFLYAAAICFSDFTSIDNGVHIPMLYSMVSSFDY